MGEAPETLPAALSRRALLRKLAVSAGSAAVLGMAASASRDAAAQTKAKQAAVGYQSTPHGAQRCDNCLQFEPPSSCKTVEGTIEPGGWCKVYVKKPT